MRLFLDEDVHVVLATALRKRGYDARHTGEEGRLGASDKEQLEFAAGEDRCFMTFNVGHFHTSSLSDLGAPHVCISRAINE